jgi:hypothetical protein
LKRRLAIAALAACLGANALAADTTLGRTVKNSTNQQDGIIVAVDVQRFQARANTLQVIEQIAVRNASQPPRTIGDDHPLEIQLPPGAKVEAAIVQRGGGQPLDQTLVPGDQKNHYYLQGALPPGETRFQVVYRVPYTGDAVIEPAFLYPVERFVVVLPKSMSFEATTSGVFKSMQSKSEDTVRVVAPVTAAARLAFRVSGTGVLAEVRAQQQAAQRSETARPGGGLGPPIDLPDPLQDYRWQILGGVCAALALGGVSVARRPAAKHARIQPRQHQRRVPA